MKNTIMAVDDSPSVREMVRMTLEDAGYEVVLASDGADAARQLNTLAVDLIISDVNMPNMNGMDLVRKVRAQPHNKFVPIVMLTTESLASVKAQGKQAGATVWIVKPFQEEQLLMVVDKVLGRS